MASWHRHLPLFLCADLKLVAAVQRLPIEAREEVARRASVDRAGIAGAEIGLPALRAAIAVRDGVAGAARFGSRVSDARRVLAGVDRLGAVRRRRRVLSGVRGLHVGDVYGVARTGVEGESGDDDGTGEEGAHGLAAYACPRSSERGAIYAYRLADM